MRHVARLALLLLATALPARAAVDLTGTWAFGDFVIGIPVRLTQTGTVLTAAIPGEPPASTGTIDPDTGAFSIDITPLVNEFALGFFCSFQIDGVAAPDSNSFTGTATASEFCVPICGGCLPPITDSFLGFRTTCHDGALDPGEVCDDGRVFGSCCEELGFPPCSAFQPSGSPCVDDGDLLTDDVCDGAGTCTHPPAECPNGVIDPGEECDDGNTSNSDCCAFCQFRPDGAPCTSDGDPFTRDVCDGAGTCQHVLCGNTVLDPGEVCDPGDPTVPGACCAADCQSVLPRGTLCDADSFPGTRDVCDGEGRCVQSVLCGAPHQGCRSDSAGSRLLLKAGGTGGQLKWNWEGVAGETTPENLGDPSVGTAVQVCLYAGGVPVATTLVPPGGTCGARPCWRRTASGFHYRDPGLAIDGLKRIRLAVQSDGSLVSLRGRGSDLALPPTLPLATPITMQLLIFEPGATRCWEAVYSTPRVNSATKVRASQ